METMTIQGVELILSQPTRMPLNWVGNPEVKRQLEAAWLILSNGDLPMSPRIIGRPGIGKTTLAFCVAQELSHEVYLFQCTVDTRPEDLLVTPVIGSGKTIRYHASPLVTAMLRGGICILDEGNRMGEKSWASLAPLLDMRRYVESLIAGVKIPAHPEFRLAVTMNQDASTFDVPDYIQSRLQPQIEIGFPGREEELAILQAHLPEAPSDVLGIVNDFLQRAHSQKRTYTTRDGVNIARYAIKLLHLGGVTQEQAVRQALTQVLDAQALSFYLEHGAGAQKPVTHRLSELLLLAAGAEPEEEQLPSFEDEYDLEAQASAGHYTWLEAFAQESLAERDRDSDPEDEDPLAEPD
jgi:MoxR-like ATPase